MAKVSRRGVIGGAAALGVAGLGLSFLRREPVASRGVNADAPLPGARKDMISDSAIQTDQAEKFVWVADSDDVAQRRTVQLGPIIDGLRVIRSGLEGSDRVIVAGTQFVASGAKLAPAVDPTSIVAQVAAQ